MKSRILISLSAIALVIALTIPHGLAAQETQVQPSKHQSYKLIDLGTLGGPNSQVNGSAPPMINNAGVVAGLADTTIPCLYLGGVESPAFKWQNGVLMNLGLLPGGCFSLPNAINSKGMMVGSGDIGVIDPQTGQPELRADFRYKGSVVNMGTFGGTNSLANSINSQGQATGGAENTDPDPWNFGGLVGLPSPTAWRAFLWQNGGLTDIGTLGGPDAFGLVINESGRITGFSFTNSIPNATTGIPTVDPFLWDRGNMIDVRTLGGTLGFGNAVNNRGQVVGFSDIAGDQTNHAFFWDRGVLTDIGTFGGYFSSAAWINNAGQVAGTAELADHTHHAFVWQKGNLTDIGAVGTDPCSNGFFINSSGQVVGTSTDCLGNVLHAFLWENGSMVDLNPYIGPNFLFVEPVAISDTGEIVGNGILTDGDVHAVVLSPNGDSDNSNEAVIPVGQKNAVKGSHPAWSSITEIRERTASTPLERVRNQTRQQYHVPGRLVAPRD